MKKFRVVVNGNEYLVDIEEIRDGASPAPARPAAAVTPQPAAKPAASAPKPKPQAPKAEEAGDGTICAPMPGTVINISVANGDQVSKGQTLLVLEAMKMENEIMAPQDGVIAEIRVEKGASVNAGEALIILS